METFVLVNITGPDVLEKQCTLKWYAEEEAYHKECALAVELGSVGELNGLCRAMNDTVQFRRDLSQALARDPGLCQSIYRAKVAAL